MGVKIETDEINLTGSINIIDENNNSVGELRSACYSPHFNQVIGIAMLKKPYWKVNQSIKLEINDQTINGTVCDLPFI